MKLLAVSKLAALAAKNRLADYLRQNPVMIFVILLTLGLVGLGLRVTYLRAETLLMDMFAESPQLLDATIHSLGTILLLTSLCGGVFLERFVGSRSRLHRLLAVSPIRSASVLLGELIPYAVIAMVLLNVALFPFLLAFSKVTAAGSAIAVGWLVLLLLQLLSFLIGVQFARGYWMLLLRWCQEWSRGRLTVTWVTPMATAFLAMVWGLSSRFTEVISHPWNPALLVTGYRTEFLVSLKPVLCAGAVIVVAAIGSFALQRLRDIPSPHDEILWWRFRLPFVRTMGRLSAVVILESGRILRDASTFGQLLGVALLLMGGAYVVRMSSLGASLYPFYAQLTSYCLALLAAVLLLAGRGRDRNLSWLVHALPLTLYEYTTGKAVGGASLALAVAGLYVILARELSPTIPFALAEWFSFFILALSTGLVLGHLWYYDAAQPTATIMALALLFVITLVISTGVSEWLVPLTGAAAHGTGDLAVATLAAVVAPLVAALVERWRWYSDL
jgi:hypothetical protein